MGCTISKTLFVMTIEIFESSIRKRRVAKSMWWLLHGPCKNNNGWYHHNFLNLRRLYVLMAWCRMKLEPKKSRSLSISKGKINATTAFTVTNQQIPTISQEPVKSPGGWQDSSMKDTRRGLETVDFATEGLLAINRCGLQGKFKVWCLKFMLILKLLRTLLVYEICSTTVETIEAKINNFTWK